jgi:hypothetical protein
VTFNDPNNSSSSIAADFVSFVLFDEPILHQNKMQQFL